MSNNFALTLEGRMFRYSIASGKDIYFRAHFHVKDRTEQSRLLREAIMAKIYERQYSSIEIKIYTQLSDEEMLILAIHQPVG